MSNILIYVKVPQYEREWCEYHFGSPCDFPVATNLNSVIRHFTIDDIFVMHMWEELTDIGCRSVQLSKLIRDWMDSNGISMRGNNYDNLRMKFQRVKDAYRKKSVNVSRGYKHERT